VKATSSGLAVFCGPSLPPSDRTRVEGVTYLPPAARGDVERAADAYDAVLLLDGVFHHDLAPSPKECAASLGRARMFGAASMGALRAAECAPYGFVPLGAIAGWYLRGIIDGDDEVAVLTHPQTQAAISVPLVNVRYVARLAHRRGLLSEGERDAFVEAARAIFYADRSWNAVLAALPASARDPIAAIARDGGDLKRLDARFALRRAIREHARLRRPIVLPATLPRAPGSFDRSASLARTLAVLPELRERYGITRVADTTLLDRIGIPTAAAMVPRSPDMLGVYNGKGVTRDAAIASAVMEATERQIGAAVALPVFRETLRSVGARLDLDACGVAPGGRGRSVDCVSGTDLVRGDTIAVPLAMVQCPWFGDRLVATTTTNGLASGNDATEAIYHALCELIERHAWSLHHVRGSLVPKLFLGPDAADGAVAPEVRFPTGDATVDALADRIRGAGLTLRAFCLREGGLPVTMVVSIVEPSSDPPMAHMGLGCALSPAHALIRALTEAAQSRVTDIQAAREDLLRPRDDARGMGEHGRRPSALPARRWYGDLPRGTVALADLPDRSGADLAADVRAVLGALHACGIDDVYAIQISPRDLPVCVVRAIVPALETLMFSGRIGARGRALLNPFAVRAIAG